MVKWNVIKATAGRYWDLDPDSLWNFIAIKLGLRMLIIDNLILRVNRPTLMVTAKGFFNYGRRAYYIGWQLPMAITYSLVLAIRRSHGRAFFKGYLHEYSKHDWFYGDDEVKRFYSFERIIRRELKLIPLHDRAIIISLGFSGKEQIPKSKIDEAVRVIRNSLKDEEKHKRRY